MIQKYINSGKNKLSEFCNPYSYIIFDGNLTLNFENMGGGVLNLDFDIRVDCSNCTINVKNGINIKISGSLLLKYCYVKIFRDNNYNHNNYNNRITIEEFATVSLYDININVNNCFIDIFGDLYFSNIKYLNHSKQTAFLDVFNTAKIYFSNAIDLNYFIKDVKHYTFYCNIIYDGNYYYLGRQSNNNAEEKKLYTTDLNTLNTKIEKLLLYIISELHEKKTI